MGRRRAAGEREGRRRLHPPPCLRPPPQAARLICEEDGAIAARLRFCYLEGWGDAFLDGGGWESGLGRPKRGWHKVWGSANREGSKGRGWGQGSRPAKQAAPLPVPPPLAQSPLCGAATVGAVDGSASAAPCVRRAPKPPQQRHQGFEERKPTKGNPPPPAGGPPPPAHPPTHPPTAMSAMALAMAGAPVAGGMPCSDAMQRVTALRAQGQPMAHASWLRAA
jgi:hypothetical protein